MSLFAGNVFRRWFGITAAKLVARFDTRKRSAER
jgi:hypothetical protein